MTEAGDDGEDDSDVYISMLQAQWVMRVLDFFSMSMIIPTMGAYLESVGGDDNDYYTVIIATTIAIIVSSLSVGMLSDWTGKVKALYIPMCSLSIVGHGLYAAADAVHILRCTTTVLIGRVLVGAGAGKAVLIFVSLGRIAKRDEVRNVWMVRFSTARSMGLFLGPAIAVGMAAYAGEKDYGGSLFGLFALPGGFLCLTNLLALVWLLLVWVPLPEQPPHMLRRISRSLSSSPASLAGGEEQRLSDFFRRPAVMLVSLAMVCCTGSAPALETVVPVIGSQALGWSSSGTGGVLMAISVAVLSNQLIVMKLQGLSDEQGHPRVDDRLFMLSGVIGLAATLLLSVAVWSVLIGRGPDAIPTAREHGWLVMAAIVAAEACFPYLGNGANMTFTRLVLTYVPQRMGICQALVNQNGPIFGSMLVTVWMSKTYDKEAVDLEAAPQTGFLGIGLVVALIAVGLATYYQALAPDYHQSRRKNKLARTLSAHTDVVVPFEQEDLCDDKAAPLLG